MIALPIVRTTPLRVVLGLPFVLFVPGYAVVAALFPEAGESPGDDDAGEDRRAGIDGIERVALSFGLSIAIVPLIGLVLNFTPWGIRLAPILVSVSGFTLLAVAVAARRRWALPPDDRFRVPYREWYAAGRTELLEPETRTDAALNVTPTMPGERLRLVYMLYTGSPPAEATVETASREVHLWVNVSRSS